MKMIVTETDERNDKTAQERLMSYVKGMEKLKESAGGKGEKGA